MAMSSVLLLMYLHAPTVFFKISFIPSSSPLLDFLDQQTNAAGEFAQFVAFCLLVVQW
jgi:hypothetical protein